MLTQKHGEPIEEKRKEISMGKYATLNTSIKKWETQHTSILMQRFSCMFCLYQYKDPFTTIIYKPNPRKVSIKSNTYEKNKDNI